TDSSGSGCTGWQSPATASTFDSPACSSECHMTQTTRCAARTNALRENGSPICEAGDVTVAFGAGDSKVVLDKVTLAVRPNEVIAILGPSGCGKSTLLRVLVGLLKPTRGEVLAHGKP